MPLMWTRGQRTAAIALGISMWIAAAIVLTTSSRPAVGLFATLILVGLMLVLLGLVASPRPLRVAPPGYRHVLQVDLQLSELSELRGVQYAALPFPDRGPAGEPLAMAFLVENVFTTPRTFRVDLRRSVVESGPPSSAVSLEGGECGLLLVLGRTKPGTRPGEYSIGFRPRATRPAREGDRVFAPPKAHQPFGMRLYALMHTVTERSDTRPAVSLPAAGYQVLFRPGMTAPDTTPLAFLNARAG